jgi:putative oxidoreductase
LKNALLWAIRLGLGALFVYAGLMKLRDPGEFAIEIANYRLLPGLAPYGAVMLPTVEIVAGLGAIVLPRTWRRAAALVIAGLMLMFTVAVSVALARGINIDCGCFGGDSSPITALTLLRDLAMLGGASALVLLDREPA